MGAGERDGAAGRASSAPRRIEDPAPRWEGSARLELVREIPGRAVPGAAGDAAAGPVATDVRDLAPAPGGRILVLDGTEATATVLDGAGRVLLRVGGRGGGPGELRTPDRVEPDAGGGLAVLERRPAAVHRWDSTGAFAGRRELRVESRWGSALVDWGPRLPEGRAVRLVSPDPTDPSRGRSAVHVAGPDGHLGRAVVSWEREGTRSGLPEVFGARRSWTAVADEHGAGRIVVARGDRYQIARYDLSGRIRSVLRRGVGRTPVTAGLRERALDRFTEHARRGGAPGGMAARLRERIPVADVLPAIGGVWASAPDGRLWVGLPGPGEADGPPAVVRAYDVFEADGEYLGNVPAPPGFRLRRVRGDLLYGSRLDEVDVPAVRVYRLVEPGEG